MVRGVNSWDEGRKNKFMKRHLFIMRRANGKSVWRVYRFTRFYDLELKRVREREGGRGERGWRDDSQRQLGILHSLRM